MNKIFTKKITLVISGLILCVFLFETALRLNGFVSLYFQKLKNIDFIMQRGTYHIMCIGDSTTALDGKESYPSQLQDSLNKRDIGVKFSVINKGLCADSSITITQLIDDLTRSRPDMVITMMGVNDWWDTLLYEEDPPSLRPAAILFLRNLKIFRLAGALSSEIINKARGINTSVSKQGEVAIVSRDELAEPPDHKQLEDSYKKAIEIEPKHYRAYIELGRLYSHQGEYNQAEEIFKQAIQINPERDWAYIELGWCYNEQGKYPQAEEMYKEAIELNPENYWPYMELVWWYSIQGKYPQAEEMLKKAIEIYPEKYSKYIDLIRWYSIQGKYPQAEEMLKKAIEIHPERYRAYIGLGRCYNLQGKYPQAEEMLKQAIKLNPGRDWAYIELGWCYNEQGKYPQAEEMLKQAININSINDGTYIELGFCYIGQKRFREAEEVFEKVMESKPRKDLAYAALALLYERHAEYRSAEEYFKKANNLRLEYYNPQTRYNYQGLKAILDQRGIKLVCVQYPMRNLEPLEKLFIDKKGIIFVDNEEIFRRAVRQKGYDEYFTDSFAGDFGHCTPKGNRLLARNIAGVIIKQCFNQRRHYILNYLGKILGTVR